MTDRLTEIEERLKAATPGPWEPYQSENFEPLSVAKRVRHPGMTEMHYVASWVNKAADQAFIANAPTDTAALLSAVKAVLAIHKPTRWAMVDPGCVTCRENGTPLAWPCPTVKAINAALEGNRECSKCGSCVCHESKTLTRPCTKDEGK
jgi:hypothetical protein